MKVVFSEMRDLKDKENSTKYYCNKCKKEILEINEAFKFTIGITVNESFVPADNTVVYHKDCVI